MFDKALPLSSPYDVCTDCTTLQYRLEECIVLVKPVYNSANAQATTVTPYSGLQYSRIGDEGRFKNTSSEKSC